MARLKYNLDEITAVLCESGRYRARLVKCEQTMSSKNNPMITWHWKLLSGEAKGKEVRSFTSLLDTALSGLKMHLEAFEFSGKVNVDTAKLIGRYAILVLSTAASEDKETGLTREFTSVAGVLPDKKKKARKAPVEDEYEDDDEYEDEDEEEDEEEEYEEDEDEDYDEDEDEDEEYEEEEKPKPRPRPKRAKKAKPKRLKKKRKKRSSDDDDDDEDLPF